MKNSNDTIENRARNPAAFGAVSQPTAPPRTLVVIKQDSFFVIIKDTCFRMEHPNFRITLSLARDEISFHWHAQKCYLKHFSISV